MACFYFSIGGLAVGFGLTRSGCASVVSALDIHRAVSESGGTRREGDRLNGRGERKGHQPISKSLISFQFVFRCLQATIWSLLVFLQTKCVVWSFEMIF